MAEHDCAVQTLHLFKGNLLVLHVQYNFAVLENSSFVWVGGTFSWFFGEEFTPHTVTPGDQPEAETLTSSFFPVLLFRQ